MVVVLFCLLFGYLGSEIFIDNIAQNEGNGENNHTTSMLNGCMPCVVGGDDSGGSGGGGYER